MKLRHWLIRRVGDCLPQQVNVWLATRSKGLRRLVQPGKEFVFDRYLGELLVAIDTTYPIELQMMLGRYDRDSSALINRFFQADWVSIDVGANVGALTLLMALRSPQGAVAAVEPGPLICSRLRRNLQLNPSLAKRVHVFEVGIAEKRGRLFWNEDPNNRGNAGLLGSSGTSVEVLTLDDIVDGMSPSRVDFLKIDVEGMELEAITGGLETIKRFRPFIYYETLDAFNQIRGFDVHAEISKMLSRIGYRRFAVMRDGRLAAVEDSGVTKSSNTLAVPIEKAAGLCP